MPPVAPESQAQQAAYDAQPYLGRPCADSHPSRIAVVAKLAGLTVADVRSCRVLEIACGDGNNLIAIAESLPESQCLGIDLSGRHIAMGQAEIAALGLKNISLRQVDLLQLSPSEASLGEFDFIIAHGFYSWVPRAVQDRLFAVARRHLAKNGVMFVSYNLLPGWRLMQVLRDFLSFHARGAKSTDERLEKALDGTALLPLLTKSQDSDAARFIGAYARDFALNLESLGGWRDPVLLYDVIGEPSTPVYFSSFVNHVGRFGLRYLGDAEDRGGLPRALPLDVLPRLLSSVDTPLDLQQYSDFARMRTFRQSLLCHADIAVRSEPRGSDLQGLFVTCRLQPVGALDLGSDAPAEFTFNVEVGPGHVLRSMHPLTKAALAIVSERAPQAIEFGALCQAAAKLLGRTSPPASDEIETLAKFLLHASAESPQALSLVAHAPPVAQQPGLLPTARAFARRQLLRGDEITTLFHENFTVDSLCRALVPLLDGTRDVTELVAAISAQAKAGKLTLPSGDAPPDPSALAESPLADDIRTQLAALARLGVLLS